MKASPASRDTANGQEDPRWRVYVNESGRVTATLSGSDPPIIVSAATPADLRQQVRTLILSALL
jgi:hypothetical protein